MHKEGHIGLTLTLLAPIVVIVGNAMSVPVAIVLALGAIGGSGLPDLDLQLPLLKHRGWTHTVWCAIVAGIIGATITIITLHQLPLETYLNISTETILFAGGLFGFGMAYGVITHLIGDMITPMGIQPFHPVTPKSIIPLTISKHKFVYEIANASNDKLNKGASAVGIISITLSIYAVIAV